MTYLGKHEAAPDELRATFFWILVLETLIGACASAYFLSHGERGAWMLVPVTVFGGAMAFTQRRPGRQQQGEQACLETV